MIPCVEKGEVLGWTSSFLTWKNGSVFTTIVTAEIGDGRDTSICAAALSYCLSGSIGYF